MQFGVNTWTWVSPFTTDRARTLLPLVRDMGFDLVEIALEDPGLADAREVKTLLADSGLAVSVCGAFGPGRDLTSDDPARVQGGLDYLREAVAFCEAVGAAILCGPMYSAVGKARHLAPDLRRREFDAAVAGLQQAVQVASGAGVTLAVEPLNRFETDLINTSEQAARLADAVGSDALHIHLDTFHMTIEENSIYDAVKRAGPRLAHVHASESNRGTPGRGLVAWDQLRRGLKDTNYTGAVVIETFTPDVKEIARAAAIWRPLAASQDLLARDGLHFLRGLLTA